jgi:copper chaperone CopZ
MKVLLMAMFFLAFHSFAMDKSYRVSGMVCQACVGHIKEAYGHSPSAQKLFTIKEINVENKTVTLNVLDEKNLALAQKKLQIILKQAGKQYNLEGVL